MEHLPLIYNPSSEVTGHEGLVPFKGHCLFKQYMPSKPVKHMIKMSAACDGRTNNAWNMQVYTGKPAGGAPEKNQSKCLVLDMTAGLQRQNITCDHFFTKYSLGQDLLQKELPMVGTVGQNKPKLPPALMTTKDRASFSSTFALMETHTLVSYCPKRNRNVLLVKNSKGTQMQEPDRVRLA